MLSTICCSTVDGSLSSMAKWSFHQARSLYFSVIIVLLSKANSCSRCFPCDNIPAGRSPLSQPPKPAHGHLLVSLISGQGHFTLLYKHTRQHIQPRGWKKRRTKKYRLGLAPSARKEKFLTLFCGFLCICELSQVCIRAKFPHSY